MKLNWGTGIAIFYSCFVLIMIFMVIKSKQNQAHLVQEDYYQKDLKYEEFRLKRQNSTQISNQVDITYNPAEKNIQLNFPDDMMNASGKVSLFRPSNKYLDKSYKLKLNSLAEMRIPVTKDMPKGLWRVKLDWENQGTGYYMEEDIIL
jgi:hypothetical protein